MVMNYIELPVLVRFNFVDNEKTAVPYLIAGPCVSYMITSKMKDKIEVDGDSDVTTEAYDGFKKFDWGLYGGIGIAFSNTILLELRYNYNFIPVLKDNSNDGCLVNNNMLCINLLIGYVD